MLVIEALEKSYNKENKVLKGVSFDLAPKEIVGLIGASGAGKSTVGRILANLEEGDAGSILFEGQQLVKMSAKKRRLLSKDIQMIFQDPYSTLSPRMKIRELIEEALIILRLEPDKNKRLDLVKEALELVSLDSKKYLERYPHELSGGERQRVGIARAIVCNPKLIIADEPTSMLDTSLRLELVALLKQLNEKRGTAFIFITHDIALTQNFCNRLIVLNEGVVVDAGRTRDVITHPTHEFTKKLIHALQTLEAREDINL
ncbi:MAG: ABC transporter ATP-binding protein [Kurthia sp.]|nr:ABC transporter ATP-binding protein [Candidatus Kurthia equi]